MESLTEMHKSEPVYNLLVESDHEFFANGILVHNCDCFAHAVRTLDRMGLGGAQVVYRDIDKEYERDIKRLSSEVLVVGVSKPDEWDHEDVVDERARTYGGLTGWKR